MILKINIKLLIIEFFIKYIYILYILYIILYVLYYIYSYYIFLIFDIFNIEQLKKNIIKIIIFNFIIKYYINII